MHHFLKAEDAMMSFPAAEITTCPGLYWGSNNFITSYLSDFDRVDIKCLLELRSEPAKPAFSCRLMILLFDEWLRGKKKKKSLVLLAPTVNPWQVEHEPALLWSDGVL